MARPKKHCCHSTPLRCTNCPVVFKCKQELKARGVRGKDLKRAVEVARRDAPSGPVSHDHRFG